MHTKHLSLTCSAAMLFCALAWGQPARQEQSRPHMLLGSPRGGIRPRAITFSPDGRFLAAVTPISGPGVHDEAMLLFDVRSGQLMWELASEKRLSSLAFSADGMLLACGEGESGGGEQGDDKRCGIVVVEVQTGKGHLRIDGHENSVLAVTFTPDGKGIVSGSFDGTMRLWDAVTGQEKERLTDHQPRFEGDELRGRIQNVVFSADGKTLAFDHASKVQLLDWKNRPKGTAIDWDGKPRGLAFSPDGRFLAASAGKAACFDVATGQERFALEDRKHVAFSHDSLWLATANEKDRCIEIIDPKTGKEVFRLKPTITIKDSRGQLHTLEGAGGPLAFSPTRKVLAACAASGIVVWELEKEKLDK
jgi:WD40 repeat protein